MKEIVKEILELAVHAPSGHNSQPWRFVVERDTIFIYNVPDKDKILFNYEQRGSMVAHGALIENIAIVASERGYKPEIDLFPQGQEPNAVAKVTLRKKSVPYHFGHLFPYILKRTTNRKPYKIVPFRQGDKEKLEQLVESVSGPAYGVSLIYDRESIKRAAGSFSVGDRLIFDNFHVHKSLFENVNWTLQEEERKREGLYVGTKELSFFDKIIFKYLLSKWSIVSVLRGIGFPALAAEKRQKLYEQCSAVGLITASNETLADFIQSGRIMQRLWLTATSLGLSLQPLSVGLLYLGQRCQREEPEEFLSYQIKSIRNAYAEIVKLFNVFGRIPTFSFRVGYAQPPTTSSLKRPPEIVYGD